MNLFDFVCFILYIDNVIIKEKELVMKRIKKPTNEERRLMREVKKLEKFLLHFLSKNI